MCAVHTFYLCIVCTFVYSMHMREMRECWVCEVCGWAWLKTGEEAPANCASNKCRSRRWNGGGAGRPAVIRKSREVREAVESLKEARAELAGGTKRCPRCQVVAEYRGRWGDYWCVKCGRAA